MAEQTNTAATKRTANATKRSTTAKKAAATRSRNQAAAARKRSTAAKKAAATRAELAKTPVDRAQEYAERAVLVPVGALLVARDNVAATVEGLRETVTSREKAEKELVARRKRLQADIKRFERRGPPAGKSSYATLATRSWTLVATCVPRVRPVCTTFSTRAPRRSACAETSLRVERISRSTRVRR